MTHHEGETVLTAASRSGEYVATIRFENLPDGVCVVYADVCESGRPIAMFAPAIYRDSFGPKIYGKVFKHLRNLKQGVNNPEAFENVLNILAGKLITEVKHS